MSDISKSSLVHHRIQLRWAPG